jgi:hypothetical protein
MARDVLTILSGQTKKSIAQNNLCIIIYIYSNICEGDDRNQVMAIALRPLMHYISTRGNACGNLPGYFANYGQQGGLIFRRLAGDLAPVRKSLTKKSGIVGLLICVDQGSLV